ncbi:MAG TPA: hypothetical protein VJN20_10550, partial [Burkholderiales bacterium]|nr:hypothetical protein [Burkholderiales bacterium]
LRAGTTGLGVDFGWGLAPTLGARLGLSGLKFDSDFETDDFDYDARAKIANVNALLDWSLFGPFRITGGLVYNKNKVDLTGQPRAGSFPVGSSLTGTVKPEREFSPYLGIGWGNVWTKGVNFYVDLGVVFQGSPQVDLALSCPPSPQCTAAQAQVAAEEQRVQDEIDRFKYYPVLNIGITVGF